MSNILTSEDFELIALTKRQLPEAKQRLLRHDAALRAARQPAIYDRHDLLTLMWQTYDRHAGSVNLPAMIAVRDAVEWVLFGDDEKYCEREVIRYIIGEGIMEDEQIARIIDRGAFKVRKQPLGWDEKRRRIALAKAQRILELLTPSIAQPNPEVTGINMEEHS